jgi:hypothetical protein
VPTLRTTHRSEKFYVFFAWLLLGLVIVGFGSKAVFDSEGLPPLTWLHNVHAVAMLAWFGLFALQPTLIQRGRTDLHRTFGLLSPLVVITFIGFAVPIALLNWNRVGDPLIITANSINLTFFMVLYGSALSWRKSPAVHKRLMIYAALLLMGPALGRIAEVFDRPPESIAPLIFALMLAPVVRDFVADRSVHAATWIGFALTVITIPLILGLGGSEVWAALLENVLGPPGADASH